MANELHDPVSISLEGLKNIYSKRVASNTAGEIHRGKQSGFARVKSAEVGGIVAGRIVPGETPFVLADVIEAVVVDVGDVEVPVAILRLMQRDCEGCRFEVADVKIAEVEFDPGLSTFLVTPDGELTAVVIVRVQFEKTGPATFISHDDNVGKYGRGRDNAQYHNDTRQ